jgi:hypothetical protein
MTPCRVTVMGPTKRWTHEEPVYFPFRYPFLQCSPMCGGGMAALVGQASNGQRQRLGPSPHRPDAESK